jgi:hypothetical protein
MDNSEFVFTQTIDEDGNKIIIGGGYKINSFFLKEDQPIMTTYNNPEDTSDQHGGKRVSTSFENLAVPAGVFYIDQKIAKVDNMKTNFNDNHNMLPEDIYDKLLALVQPIQKKRFTKKNNKLDVTKNTNKKRKTRRNK